MNNVKGKKVIIKITKNKFRPMFLILVLLGIILFAGNTYNADYNNYKQLYSWVARGIKPNGVEVGFYLCMKLATIFGLEYAGFYACLGTLLMILLGLYIWKYSVHPTLVILLYLIFPFVLDTIQIRNSIVAIIILYALTWYLNAPPETKHKRLMYILIILVATLFHKVAAVYLIFLLVDCKLYSVKKIVYSILAIEVLISILNTNFIEQVLFLVSEHARIYILSDRWNTQILTKIVFLIFVMIIPILYRSMFVKLKTDIQSSINVYKVLMISMLFYILLAMDVDFFRSYRNIFLLIYVSLTNNLKNLKDKNSQILATILIFMVVIFLAYAFIAFSSNNVYNIFHYNIFLN